MFKLWVVIWTLQNQYKGACPVFILEGTGGIETSLGLCKSFYSLSLHVNSYENVSPKPVAAPCMEAAMALQMTVCKLSLQLQLFALSCLPRTQKLFPNSPWKYIQAIH